MTTPTAAVACAQCRGQRAQRARLGSARVSGGMLLALVASGFVAVDSLILRRILRPQTPRLHR